MWLNERADEMKTALAACAEIAVDPVQHDYSGFPIWHALLVTGGRELRVATWFADHHLPIYLPQWTKQIRIRGARRMSRLCAVIPGMLFAPAETFQTPRLHEIFDLCHIHGALRTSDGEWCSLSKADIEKIRVMEAQLNLAPVIKSTPDWIKVGAKVRFANPDYESWGEATISELVKGGRIGVEVRKLFGRLTRVYVPASEIVPM